MVPSFNARPNDWGFVQSGGDRTQLMYYTYVIKSRVKNFCYKGFCENLQKRLAEHNSGMTKSNKAYKPFDLVYFEKSHTKEDAITKEKYWKSAAGRRYLRNKRMVPSFNG